MLSKVIEQTAEVFINTFHLWRGSLEVEAINTFAHDTVRERLVKRDEQVRLLVETLRTAPALVDPDAARQLAKWQASDARYLDLYSDGLCTAACKRYEAEVGLEVLARALARLAIAHIDGWGWWTGERTTY